MQNFWEKQNWEKEDKHLLGLEKMPFRRKFSFIPEKKGFYVIRGPRQVGKSSWLKTILSFSVKKWGANQCFYLSCENIQDYRELTEILRSQQKTKVILLDEVTFVEDWDRAIKFSIDSGMTNILVITGSSASDLRKGADRMPGRHEGGGEFELLPMSLEEFKGVRKQAGWQSQNEIEEIQSYFQIGGFPAAVAEAGMESKLPKSAIKTYSKWLIGDFVRLGKQEVYLKEVVGQIGRSMTTPLSLQGLAQKTQMGSHHTAQEYVSLLEDCFALQTLYAIDSNTGSFRFRKDKKFYFRDPLVYWLSLDWLGIKPPRNAEEILAEMVAAEHLKRMVPRFGYFHSQKGEIDFYQYESFAIEVKWADQISNLSQAYLNMIVPEKKVWFKKNYLK